MLAGLPGNPKPPEIFSGTQVGYTTQEKQKSMNRMITKNEFKRKILDSLCLSLVQFRIDWSGPCQIIAPVYDELASSYSGQANFFTVDVEAEKGLGDEYGVIELPTILFFKEGRLVDHVKGLAPKNVIIGKIENALAGELN